MPEIIVKYKSKRTLEALQDLAKYFDYKISLPASDKNKDKLLTINGVTIIPADNSVDMTNLSDIYTGKNIYSKQLRIEPWQRKK